MLEVSHVDKTFCSGFFATREVKAADDVSLHVDRGEIVGLVGGSGSGKTTLSRIIAGLLKPDAGTVTFNGANIESMTKAELKQLRQTMQFVFQNPQKTFNPRFTVYDCCAEPLRLFGLCGSKEEERDRVHAMIEQVGISPDQLGKYPHEISGGQAQRISIARTLALEPDLIICDEPTSMLDISVQAHIIDLLKRVNAERGIALLFISHDLDVVRHLCQRVYVMEQGRIVESGDTAEVFADPRNDFTRHLLEAAL